MRLAGLTELDDRLAALERHLGLAELPMAQQPGACCSAAAVVLNLHTAGASQPHHA